MTAARLHQIEIWCDGTDTHPHGPGRIATYGLFDEGEREVWSPMSLFHQQQRDADGLPSEEASPATDLLVGDDLRSVVGGSRRGRKVGGRGVLPEEARSRLHLDCRKCGSPVPVRWENLVWALDTLRDAGRGYVTLGELRVLLGAKRRIGGV